MLTSISFGSDNATTSTDPRYILCGNPYFVFNSISFCTISEIKHKFKTMVYKLNHILVLPMRKE